MNKEDALKAIKSGVMDDSIAELKRELDARVSSPTYKGRKPVTAADRGPIVHCRGKAAHPPHYHTNVNSRYTELNWCTGTL